MGEEVAAKMASFRSVVNMSSPRASKAPVESSSPQKTTAKKGTGQQDVVRHVLRLPVARVKTIMKSSPEVGDSVPQDTLHLITKATELFVDQLVQKAYEQSSSNSKHPMDVNYEHVAEVVQSSNKLDFLRDIVPKKVFVRDIQHLIFTEDSDEDAEPS